jgi:hypothetical protein
MAGNQPGERGVADAPDLVRAQLARMNEQQLQRLLLWLDERGAAGGRSFAVHQDDPSDPATRELVELRLRKGDAPRRKQRLRLRFGLGMRRPQPAGLARG